MYPGAHVATKGRTGPALTSRCGVPSMSSPPPMTSSLPHDDWDPGRRKDPSRERTDRRRLGWREFRRSYPGIVVTMAIAAVAFLGIDGLLYMRYRRYQRETQELRASMSDVERKRADAILAQNENRLKVMVEMFKR